MAYKEQKFIFTNLEVEQAKIKAPADLASGGSLLPGSQTAVFSLGPHIAEGVRGLFGGLFHKDTCPIHQVSTLMT